MLSLRRTYLSALALVIAAVSALPVRAVDLVESYKFDVGVGIGMSGYLGDLNETNPFSHPGFTANAGVRYLIDSRWALKGQLSVASLSGNSDGFHSALPDNQSYSFHSTVYDLGFRGEANFFAYGIGETYKRLRRWTPYLTLGLGMTMASTSPGSFFAVNIPMGVGVKFKLKPRLNLNAEFTMTKVFGDKIDSPELTDLYHIKSSFVKNTDWYSMLSIGISYEFGARCVTCHRID